MYLPRNLISHLYLSLQRTHTQSSPPILLLASLDPDALCATRMLSALLKRDFIPHTIRPIAGYADLTRVGETLVRNMRDAEGGGVVVCLGVGGLVDLEELWGLENEGMGGISVWIFENRRPWNLSNVFGVQAITVGEDGFDQKIRGVEKGMITRNYIPGRGGIIVFDDGDIEESMEKERNAYCELAEMPELGDEQEEDEDSDDEDDEADNNENEDGEYESDSGSGSKRKRKSTPHFSEDEGDSEPEEGTPNKRRKSNSSSPLSSTPERRSRPGLLILGQKQTKSPAIKEPSPKELRRQLLAVKRKHDEVLEAYNSLGTSYSEPISSLMWNLASDLGREDNDLLWDAIVGISSLEISGRTSSGMGLDPISSTGEISTWNNERGAHIKSIFRDEVRRLNHPDTKDLARELGGEGGVIQTHAKHPNDKSIRISPEPRFLLVRHWSLYDSMLHSPYLSAKLHIWNESGKRKLNKLLAKMGISLNQSKQNYTHMDMDIKRSLREKLLKYAPIYGLEGLIPPESRYNTKDGWGFVRCWGWKACLSALDAGHVLGSILEVGDIDPSLYEGANGSESHGRLSQTAVHSGISTPRNADDTMVPGGAAPEIAKFAAIDEAREDTILKRFFTAYDALRDISALTKHIATAQLLHRAILRTGTSLIEKRQIKRLKPFHIAVVKDGPDVRLFTHPGALVKLALWVAEAIAEMEGMKGGKGGELVMAGLDEERGVYIVAGLGGGRKVIALKEREKKRAERKAEREKQREAKKKDKEKRKEARRLQLEALGESDVESDEESESSEEEDSDFSDDDEHESREERGKGLNRFGNAFQEVIEESGARVKVDSFEHCVVEVKKEDLQSFFESLCMKSVVG